VKLFPNSAAEKIGLTTVLKRLCELVDAEPTRDRILQSEFLPDSKSVEDELARVSELQNCLRFDDPLPLRVIIIPSDLPGRGRPAGAALDTEDFLSIRALAATVRLVGAYFDRRADKYPMIGDMVQGFATTPSVERSIGAVFDDDGQIRDNASPDLRMLRSDLARSRSKLRNQIVSALKRVSTEGFAADDQPTVRAGRLVIPVRAEARRKVSGFVHDVSATGQTVYVEPTECLDLNNRIRELETAHERELLAIRVRLTDEIRDQLSSIVGDSEILLRLDALRGKARLANEMNAVVPELNEDGLMHLVAARNPELAILFRNQSREVVPMDVTLDDDCRTLIISGPNAGGKSVAMKTVGLCASMLALGMPLPLDERSSVCLFTSVMVDIGDEQSVEDDLSTYSSHLKKLSTILSEADDRTLVLLDEAGTGTDPEEGAGIARAALEQLTRCGARTIATTHHGSLKIFAHDADQTANGSMQFDVESLLPTFRFQADIPGSSYASEIAARAGLPAAVVERAKTLIGEGKARVEQLIIDLEGRNVRLKEQLERSAAGAAALERERDQLAERVSRLQESRDEIRERAISEAETILDNANAAVEKAVREIRESQAARDTTRSVRKSLELAKTSVRKSRSSLTKRKKSRKKKDSGPPVVALLKPISPGDLVTLDNGEARGEILEISGREVHVVFGDMQMRIDANRLTKVSEARPQSVKVSQFSSIPGASTLAGARMRIDLRGRRVDEALAEVERFIDEGIRSNLDRLEILHGKGTGALRSSIDEYLHSRPDVLRREDAPWNEGGPGVSIVWLKTD
jgi:DNA mismatch repair protein MutS2